MKFIRSRLGWKLMISYTLVVIIGLATMALAAELVAPASFERHMQEMRAVMGQMGPGMAELEADLFANYRAAVTEALVVAIIVALVTAIGVSIFVSRRVVTPIRQMMQASHRIADGHYRERVEVTSQDELGELADRFNQMAATLEHTETMRRDLIANVAHELRTPLSGIKGYMEGLIDGVLPAQPDTYQQVYSEADRLQRLVNDLQELSRVEAGAFELDLQPVDVADLITQIANRLRPQFDEKSVTLVLNLPNNSLPVRADEDRIYQVLTNLIGNALQYTPSGGMVTIIAAVEANNLKITVKDTGIGLALEHLPHLFTRFYRVDRSRSRAGGGSGIGLTIAKLLIEAHGGKIWATSPGEGQGSEFCFTLPFTD